MMYEKGRDIRTLLFLASFLFLKFPHTLYQVLNYIIINYKKIGTYRVWIGEVCCRGGITNRECGVDELHDIFSLHRNEGMN